MCHGRAATETIFSTGSRCFVVSSQLRVAIVEALGQMVHIMTWQKLQEQLPKLLQAITGLYKRHSEPFHVTQVLLHSSRASGRARLQAGAAFCSHVRVVVVGENLHTYLQEQSPTRTVTGFGGGPVVLGKGVAQPFRRESVLVRTSDPE